MKEAEGDAKAERKASEKELAAAMVDGEKCKRDKQALVLEVTIKIIF